MFEIYLCQLLWKLFKDLKVTGLSSLSALAGSNKSVRQDNLLVAVVTNSDCKSPQPSPSNSQHVSPITGACQLSVTLKMEKCNDEYRQLDVEKHPNI